MNTPFRRVVVIAPTRATCANVHTVINNADLPATLLLQEAGAEINSAVAKLPLGGFGIVAGTGTGKTAAIRHMCHQIVGADLRVGVVTREHEATPATYKCNVLVVTPGIAFNWLKSGLLNSKDLIIIDEIHQTSEHLELAMAFAKRAGCTFVWMSATVDPEIYRKYLDSRTVIQCSAFDPSRMARVEVVDLAPREFLIYNLSEIARQDRAVAMFVPTRAMAEDLADMCNNQHGINAGFYHGGESADKLRPYLTGAIDRPFIVFMTIAGASSLNIVGLDKVVIVDNYFTEVVRNGVRSLELCRLGNNELRQMGGRVDGRAEDGQITILSDREIDYHAIKPTAPQFKLGGDLEQLALACARVGVDARKLDLIGSFDHTAYAKVVERFCGRGLITVNNDGEPSLTELGRRVENLPVRPAWAELLCVAQDLNNPDLLNAVVITSCVEQLYGLTTRNWDKDAWGVNGSDHLTAYQIVTAALLEYGYVRRGSGGKTEYALGKKREFARWCKDNGFSQKAIGNILLAASSVFKALGLELPAPTDFEDAQHGSKLHTLFVELLAAVQSLDYVRNEHNSVAGTVFACKGGMASNYSVLGTIRHWTDKKGERRASIEGTKIPEDVVQRYARQQPRTLVSDDGVVIEIACARTFAGENLGSTTTAVYDVDAIPQEWQTWLRNQRTARQNAAEIARMRIAVSDLVQQASRLRIGNYQGMSFELQHRLSGYSYPPFISDPAGMQLWMNEATAAIAEAEAHLANVNAQEAEDARQFGQLQKTAIDCRDQANALLADHKDDFSDSLYYRLLRYDVDDDALPTNTAQLRVWVTQANAVIVEANAYIARQNASRSSSVTDITPAALAALAGRFNK